MMSAKDESYNLSPDFPSDDLEQKFIKNNKEESSYFKIKKFRFALSKKQREDLLQTAAGYSRVHELMIETQMTTGIRVGELVNLRIEDVHLNERILIINAHKEDKRVKRWKPKTDAGSRIIPIRDSLVPKLRGYINEEKRKIGYFFISQKDSAFRTQSVIAFVNKYARESKSIGHVIGSHALRRTFASYLLDNNTPIGKISKLLGHASIEITMRYLFQIDSLDGYDEIRKSLEGMVNK